MILMWTDNLSVGVKYFDDDHKRLIRMINELHGAIQDVDAQGMVAEEEIEIALHRLENYFKYHCLQEEVFMAKVAFPELEQHKLQHKEFFDRVAVMSQSFRGSRNPAHAAELMQFMYDWLTNHIYITDKKYGDYLLSSRISPNILQQSKPSTTDRSRFLKTMVPVSNIEKSS
jgi:hemerythrin